MAEVMEGKIGATKQERLATFRAELNTHTRTMIFAMSASAVSVAGLAFAAGRLGQPSLSGRGGSGSPVR